ncbi:cell division protein [Bifidobacterium sp. W8109]|uniref:cell division protein n=1 Tax=Bifidobacterium TaxID=1678 RepID=UPI0018DDA98B|nr:MULTISPECIES: cell division protein [Bifidobacterium]MBH9971676.1 cell division protein [Bifidobacterium asteroides]MBI0073155.1 cell division protein [Bifidobacterium sp. W8110]
MMNEQTQERDDGEPIDDSTRTSAPKPAVDMKDLPDLQEDRSESGNPRSEFTTVYDIIDRIQAMLDEAKAPIFSPGLVKVDRDELADDLNELKKMLPVQLERASALMREAERRLNTAQTQANATISDAQSRAADIVKEAGEQARFLAGQENVVAIARQKAQTIIDTAQSQADRLVQGADGYAAQVMGELDTQLGKMSQDVRAGLEVLHQREQEAARSMNASVSDQGKDTQG